MSPEATSAEMSAAPGDEARVPGALSSQVGALVINADDWGRDRATSDRILECALRRVISSASGMVFMQDSERAANVAKEKGIDIGLHLNLTEAFSSAGVPAGLLGHQEKVARFLLSHRFCQTVFHPGLASSFEYVTKSQLEEFCRIYGDPPRRIDGHHHMHLAENVLSGQLLPAGTLVRRNFSFVRGEKSWINRKYREFVDRRLERRHRLVDFLFSIEPIRVERLEKIVSDAQHAVVELETHPANADDFEFLTSDEMIRVLHGFRIAPNFTALVIGETADTQS